MTKLREAASKADMKYQDAASDVPRELEKSPNVFGTGLSHSWSMVEIIAEIITDSWGELLQRFLLDSPT